MMIELTTEEVKAHQKKIRDIREKASRATMKFNDGDITKKKWQKVREEVKEEEAEFIKTSGVILYFGKMFRASV